MPLPDKLPENILHPSREVVHRERYVQDKKLGAGNFGTAYLIIDQESNKNNERYKVLKRIHVGNVEPGETDSAVKEAKLLSRLDHDNIVKFHESFMDGNYFCIITEYCDGGDMDMALQSYKKKDTCVSERQVVDWLFQLLRALFYLHSKHILHRDLKAKNIFLKANRIKLGDFGISKILMGTADMASTFVGTPYYMSPEVIKHDKYNDKSDIWSLGCILFEICSLKHAFDGQSLMAVMYKICTGDIPDLPQNYSRSLNNMLIKMLAREQDERASAKELLQHPLFQPPSEQDQPTGLTPKERLRLKKQREADKKIQKLRELAEQKRLENEQRRRESQSRNFYRSSIETSPPSSRERYSFEERRPATSGLVRLNENGYDNHNMKVPDKRAFTQVELPRYRTNAISPDATSTNNDLPDSDKTLMGTTKYVDTKLSLANARSLSDDSTFIPEDEELANTLYELEDFDDLESSDVELDDADIELDDENMYLSDSEYREMINNFRDVLNIDDSTITQQKLEDPPQNPAALTKNFVSSQIESMRNACLSHMGEEVFKKAYQYLRGVWSKNLMPSAPEYSLAMKKIREIVPEDHHAFLLEQLVYLENENEMYGY